MARRRVLGVRDATLFTVSAMLVIDQLTATASIGPSAIGWWVVVLIAFLVPNALISAELSSAYPDQGGLYVWVKRAFGSRWAARTTYWYWVNVALWMPSVFLLFAGTLAELMAPDLGKWPRTAISLALVWCVVWIGAQRLEVGRWVSNAGALAKAVLIAAIAVGGVVVALQDGAATPVDLRSAFALELDAATLFLPVLVFQLLGFELIASLAGEVEQPTRTVHRAIGGSAVILSVLYVAGTVGILLALPLDDLRLVSGLVATLEAIFGASELGRVAVYAFGAAALYAFFTGMTTWALGANRAVVEAAEGGELPAVFGRAHPERGTPVAAFVLMGVVASVVLVGTTVVLDDDDALYYAIFAASSVVFLLPYLLMFPAFLRLRRIDPHTPRPYRAPGGAVGARVWVGLTSVSVLASVVLFLWTPGAAIDWSYTGSLLVTVAVTLVLGELVVAAALGTSGRASAPGPSAAAPVLDVDHAPLVQVDDDVR